MILGLLSSLGGFMDSSHAVVLRKFQQHSDIPISTKGSDGMSSELSLEEKLKELSKVTKDDILIGNRDAKNVMIEYFSPTCFGCRSFAKNIFPQIKKYYIDKGKLLYIKRGLVFSKQDFDALILARCRGDVEDYLNFVNLLLEEQGMWAYKKNFVEILTNIGIIGGIPAEQYASCLANEGIKKVIFNNHQTCRKYYPYKPMATPTVILNGKIIGNENYSARKLRELLDKELKKNE